MKRKILLLLLIGVLFTGGLPVFADYFLTDIVSADMPITNSSRPGLYKITDDILMRGDALVNLESNSLQTGRMACEYYDSNTFISVDRKPQSNRYTKVDRSSGQISGCTPAYMVPDRDDFREFHYSGYQDISIIYYQSRRIIILDGAYAEVGTSLIPTSYLGDSIALDPVGASKTINGRIYYGIKSEYYLTSYDRTYYRNYITGAQGKINTAPSAVSDVELFDNAPIDYNSNKFTASYSIVEKDGKTTVNYGGATIILDGINIDIEAIRQTGDVIRVFVADGDYNGILRALDFVSGDNPRHLLTYSSDPSALQLIDKFGYYGLSFPDGSDTNWLRTTQNGLLPYSSADGSSLGTNSWRFNEAHINTIYENGQKLSDKYATISELNSAKSGFTNKYTTLNNLVQTLNSRVTNIADSTGDSQINVQANTAFHIKFSKYKDLNVGNSNNGVTVTAEDATGITLSGTLTSVGVKVVKLGGHVFIFNVEAKPSNSSVNVNVN